MESLQNYLGEKLNLGVDAEALDGFLGRFFSQGPTGLLLAPKGKAYWVCLADLLLL